MISQLPSCLSLQSLDEPWHRTLQQSLLLRPFKAIASAFPSVASVGNLLQMGGFLVALVLFAALGLHQFAADKNGLAIISTGGFILWLAGYLLGGSEKRRTTAIDFIVLLYFGANVISAGASHYLAASLHGLEKVVVYIIAYFYLTSILGGNPRRKAILLGVIMFVALAVSLYGFWQYHIHVEPLATWEDPTVENKGTRIFSTLDNPNLLAGYLLPLIALVASLGAAAISVKKWIVGVPIICIAGAIAVATLLTGSRGGFVGLFALLGSFAFIIISMVWRNYPKMRMPMVGVVIAGLIGGVLALHFVPAFEQRVNSIFAGAEHSSNAYRMQVWRASFKMFKDNWWFGVGPGNQAFVLAYGLYMTSGFDALGTYCVPLEVGVECGVLGLAVFAVLIVALFARAHLAFWSTSGWQRWLVAGAATGLAGMMVHGMVDTVFYRPQVQFLFWLLVAMLTTVDLPGDKTAAA